MHFRPQAFVACLGRASDLDMTNARVVLRRISNFREGMIDSVRIGVVKEVYPQFIGIRMPECFAHKLRTQCRTADTNDEQIRKSTLWGLKRAGMYGICNLFYFGQGFSNRGGQFFAWARSAFLSQ